MGRRVRLLIYVVLAAGIFSAGYISNRQHGPVAATGSAKHAPTYSCPMHPQYTSDRQGDCPICGMRLEPVAARDSTDKSASASLDNPGMVVVGAARQQLIGVRTDEVRRAPSSHVLRVPGRIAVDDQRLYRIVAAADGWIVDLGQNTVGRFVKKDQFLASYYQKDLLATERLFLLSIPANEPLQTQTRDFSQASIRTAGSANPQFPIDSLRGLGMSDLQIEEIHRTRTASPHVNIYSPVSGFVLTRNVSPSQRFDKGTELYRIADISRVWVMTDIFEKDRQFLKPGAEATILYQDRRLKARMSEALPQFDAQSRTLKFRFELDNPGYVLQPDMFVDVVFEAAVPPAVTVPSEAVVDSGLRKTVFVDRGNGYFEPRQVATGWRIADQVEIVKGLMPGERIVIAGTFLMDSESRMKAPGAGIIGTVQKDPVCGMDVDEKKAAAAGRTADHQGHTYYFCADECKKKFEAEPAKYVDAHDHEPAGAPGVSLAASKPSMPGMMSAKQTSSQPTAEVKDVVCGMNVDPKDAVAAGLKAEHQGNTYYFCSDQCKTKFVKEPAKYAGR